MAFEGAVRLTDGGELDQLDPGIDDVVAAVDRLGGAVDEFLILERGADGQTYMQITGGPERFILEYRDGSKERHFQCTADRELALAALLSYAAGDEDDWQSMCDWLRLDMG
jgi:hypothetical protein